MYVTSEADRAGVLIAVITGGRPELKRRPTASYLDSGRDAGVNDVVWAVSDQDAPGYERDHHDLLIYERAWAEQYAAAHWMNADPPGPGTFLGAFPGREWACQEAERRGCWAVLQLDDNINQLRLHRNGMGVHLVKAHGGLGLFLDLLAGVALSTNARTVGAVLSAVSPSAKEQATVARPGFPYSLFLERVGPGREPWFGPFEDDITHALQYGSRADGATAAVMPPLSYIKEHKSKDGMRTAYGADRAVALQRLFPQSAKIGVKMTSANGHGARGPRVFHTMPPGAIRNPLVVRDPALFGKVRDRLQALTEEWVEVEAAANREKVRRRVQQAEKMRQQRELRESRTPHVVTPAPALQLPSEAEVAGGAAATG